MNEDFNTAEALAVLFNLSREVNSLLSMDEVVSEGVLSEIDSFYKTYGGNVLGIITEKTVQHGSNGLRCIYKMEDDLIKTLIDTRNELRACKQWELADKVRDRLSELGIIIEDKKDKVAWRKKK